MLDRVSADVVKAGKGLPCKYYWVSTTLTFDKGLETMVFDCTKDGEVLSWTDRYVAHYATRDAAEAGHKDAVSLVKKGDLDVS